MTKISRIEQKLTEINKTDKNRPDRKKLTSINEIEKISTKNCHKIDKYTNFAKYRPKSTKNPQKNNINRPKIDQKMDLNGPKIAINLPIIDTVNRPNYPKFD